MPIAIPLVLKEGLDIVTYPETWNGARVQRHDMRPALIIRLATLDGRADAEHLLEALFHAMHLVLDDVGDGSPYFNAIEDFANVFEGRGIKGNLKLMTM